MSTPQHVGRPPYPDPTVYLFPSNHFRLMNDFIYNLFHVDQHRSIRRTAVSLLIGLVVYIIGLGIAAYSGFARDYIQTATVYVVVVSIAFVADYLRWSRQAYIASLNDAREAFIYPLLFR